MIKSRHLRVIKLDNAKYVIFNNLLLRPIYLEKPEYLKFKYLNKYETDENFKKCGIYIESHEKDKEAEQIMRNAYLSTSKMPSFAYFIVTDACNLACKYCFIENNSCGKKSEPMTYGVASKAMYELDVFCQKSGLDEFEIIFYGGEPLIQIDLIEKICASSSRFKTKFKFSMISNGTCLTEKIVDVLHKYNIKIGISIDGPKFINDSSRVFKNKDESVYDRVLLSIDLLKNSNVDFSLSMTISEYVLDNQKLVLDWLKEIKLPIAFNIMHLTDSKYNWKSYYKRASDFLHRAYIELLKIGIVEDRVSRNVISFENEIFKFGDCGAVGVNQLTFLPNGNVVVCHGDEKTGKNILGNIMTTDVQNLLNNCETEKWLKRSPIMNKKCIRCPAIYICGGGCGNQSKHLFGDESMVDKAFCLYSKKSLLFILKQGYIKIQRGGERT